MVTTKLAVLPGKYTVEVPPKSKFLGYGGAKPYEYLIDGSGEQGIGDESTSTTADSGDGRALTFTDGFSQELIDDAKNEIYKHIDLCIARMAFDAARCPFSAGYGWDNNDYYRNPHWTLVKKPTLSEPEYKGNGYGTISSDEPGEARLSYQSRTFDSWDDETEDATISFTVGITVESGDRFTFDWTRGY